MHVDVAILGGGCAGLSLGTALAANAPRTVVLERRAQYDDDRTWSGWAIAPHRFSHLARKRWSRWRVTTAAAAYERHAGSIVYESIASRDFYAGAMAAIAASDSVDLLTGVSVRRVVPHGQTTSIVLEDGRTIEARRVIDTLPAPRSLEFPWLWQSFVGFEIESSQAAFDDVVDLMDFREPANDRLRFVYALPFTAHTALVEMTFFSATPPSEADLEASLRDELARRCPGGYRVRRVERGRLPMSPAASDGDIATARAGIAGGALRPATGYAFHAIQRWATRCSSALASGAALQSTYEHEALAWMDRIFFTVLRNDFAAGPALYARLFARSDSDALARFLGGIPNAWDLVRVVRSLPLRTFLQTAWADAKAANKSARAATSEESLR